MEAKPEVWLRGPVEGVPALLQPVAHALLQVQEELQAVLINFPDHLLWEKPAGMASTAFHLQHMKGVLDRLLTYARGGALSSEQLQYLQSEGKHNPAITSTELVQAFSAQVYQTIEALKAIDEKTLSHTRMVGRQQIPSTVIGLLVHAAEHTTRHYGQLLVTVRVLTGKVSCI